MQKTLHLDYAKGILDAFNKTDYSEPSRRHNLVMGLTRLPVAECTSTLLTKPSEPGNVFRTLARGHWHLGMLSSTIRTRSPVLKLGLGCIHRCRRWSIGRYSDIQRFQNCSTKNCTFPPFAIPVQILQVMQRHWMAMPKFQQVIRRERFKILGVIRDCCNGTVVDYRFHLTKQSV